MPAVRTVTTFLALLAVTAELAVLAAVALAVASPLSPAARRLRRAAASALSPSALWLAFAVAGVCTLGSLYLSEVAHFTPCRLCWYQRIAMYPLVPLLGLAAWRRDPGIRPYALALAGIGAPISAWHVLVERFPTLEGSVCDPAAPCSAIWVNTFGYLTIPTMALSGFLLVAVLLLLARPEPGPGEGEEAGTGTRPARAPNGATR
jgi:disulfide bond formation protein DsbB